MDLKGRFRRGLAFRLHKRLRQVWHGFIQKITSRTGHRPCVGHHELPKKVYSLSLKKALAQCVVHLVPIAVSVVLITINLRHLFLGRQYPGYIASQPFNSLLLQVAAKLHEMTIVASLAIVILQVIRGELVHGSGVALGAIGGAYSFSSLGYLVSPAFWGAILSSGPKLPRARLYSILILCTLLAGAVGPSSAVLMIPRSQTWIAGGARIWFAGEEEEVYPIVLPRNKAMQWLLCSDNGATDNPFCPSGGYTAISQEISKNTFTIANVDEHAKTQRVLQDHTPVDLRLRNTIKIENHVDIDALIMKWSFRGVDCQTGAVAGRMMEAIRARKLALDFAAAAWNAPFSAMQPSISQYKYPETTISSCEAQIPMVKTACSAALNVSTFDTVMNFPVLKTDECWTEELPTSIPSLNETLSSKLKVIWTPLPSKFGPTSTGMILQSPLDAATNTRLVVGCSIGAGWSKGSVSNPKDIWMYQGIPSYGSPWIRGFEGGQYVPDPSWRNIEFGPDWLSLLAPAVADEGNATTLELMIEHTGVFKWLFGLGVSPEKIWNESPDRFNRSVTVEAVLAVVIADALSKEGTLGELDGVSTLPWHDWSVKNAENNDDFSSRIFDNNDPYKMPVESALVVQQATVTIVGLAYVAGSYSDYLAIGALCVYILVALLHTGYLLRYKQSSASWNNLTELLALAHNSPPSKISLQNTGAGIKHRQTYGQVAVVRAIAPNQDCLSSGNEGSDHRHLALVFQQEQNLAAELQGLLPQPTPKDATRPSPSVSQRTVSQGSVASLDVIQKEVIPDVCYG